LLLCLAGLAGCSDGEGQATAGPEATPAGTGTLHGIVVDEAVRPLEGAAVQASGPSGILNATTGTDGTFRFEDLSPGVYIVVVSKAYYSTKQEAVDVSENVAEPPLAKFQLVFQQGLVPVVELYKFEGFFECSAWPTNGCANVNIVTGIMLCSFGLPCFNTTQDRSVELIPITPQPDFIQSEMVWEPTNDQGRAMTFGLFAATREELQDGFADGYNYTEGESPLMLQLQGEELKESRIGIEGRQMGIQVSVGVSTGVPGGCPGVADPCGLGVSVQQPYTTFTHAFYGFAPPPGWLFTETGRAPPPPPA
jgi:hypothetical protein